jgi:hypothetical protein
LISLNITSKARPVMRDSIRSSFRKKHQRVLLKRTDLHISFIFFYSNFLYKLWNSKFYNLILFVSHRWLSQVAKRALYTLKVSKLNSNKTLQERREMMAQLNLCLYTFSLFPFCYSLSQFVSNAIFCGTFKVLPLFHRFRTLNFGPVRHAGLKFHRV